MTVTAVAIASLITKLGLVRDDVTFQLYSFSKKIITLAKTIITIV